MNRLQKAIFVTVTMTAAGLLTLGGAANAATPGELNLNLESDCSDMAINPGQTQMDECVQLLQEDLNVMGASVAPDGYFGTETQGAVTRFQESFGVNDREAGVADQPTRHALLEDVTAKQATANYDPNAGPNAICDTASGLPGFLGDVFGEPCKILFDTGTAN